ncbi:energy-coupling factor transporter ATPase [Feifania hominis]|uniref:energy-coupling factor transporter ATPase n=1 Tax=Feifania hominis TaxID=2763660 RepID=UPI002015E97B|nr:energy-coupling factor transporter ATPase [Feifania hominis]
MEEQTLIETRALSFWYQDPDEAEPRKVLRDINLTIRKGEFVAVLGHNGCGKSTLAKHLNGILAPCEGTVLVEGMDTRDEKRLFDIRQRVGVVFQNPDNQLVATIVEEDIAFGPENLGLPPEKIRERVTEALTAVDMLEYREQAPHHLSGGQKQRIAIAGVIAMRPDCIVLDEPTAMLDPVGRAEVMKTILHLNRDEGITVVLITHYMAEAVQAGRVIIMDEGRVVRDAAPREVFSQVEYLRSIGLEVPQATDLVHRLRADGYPVGEAITTQECVEALAKLLKGSAEH